MSLMSTYSILERVKETEFDLIMLDEKLLKLDGYQTIKTLKESDDYKEYKDIPVILVTASALRFEEGVKKFRSEGYLRKPIRKDELIVELKKFVKLDKTIKAA